MAAADKWREKALGVLFTTAAVGACLYPWAVSGPLITLSSLSNLDFSILPRQCPLPSFAQPGLNIAANFGGD